MERRKEGDGRPQWMHTLLGRLKGLISPSTIQHTQAHKLVCPNIAQRPLCVPIALPCLTLPHSPHTPSFAHLTTCTQASSKHGLHLPGLHGPLQPGVVSPMVFPNTPAGHHVQSPAPPTLYFPRGHTSVQLLVVSPAVAPNLRHHRFHVACPWTGNTLTVPFLTSRS